MMRMMRWKTYFVSILAYGAGVISLAGCNFGFMSVGNPAADAVLSGTDNQKSLSAALVPTKLVVTSAFPTAKLKVCQGPFTVTSRSAKNVESGMSQDLTFSLSTSGNGSFYSDAACANLNPTPTLRRQTSQLNFFYKGTTPAIVELRAEAQGYESVKFVLEVKRVVHQFLMGGPSVVTLGRCNSTSPITVTAQDIDLVTFGAPQTLHVSLSGGIDYYAASNCAESSRLLLNTLIIPAGATSGSFYTKVVDRNIASLSFRAMDGDILPGNKTIAVNREVTTIKLESLPLSPIAGRVQGPFTVKSYDGHNGLKNPLTNTTINLTAVDAGGTSIAIFCFDNDCTNRVDAANPARILSSTNTTPPLYIKVTDTTPSASTVAATATMGVTVLEGDSRAISPQLVATGLVFSNLPTDPIVGKPSGPFKVKAIDGFGRLINVVGNKQITLASPHAADIFCYDIDCSNPVVGNIATITNGTNSTPDLYFNVKTPSAVTKAVTATSAPLDAISQNVTPRWIVTRIGFVSLPTNPVSGKGQGPFRVKSYDGLGTLKNPISAITVNLGAIRNPGGTGIATFCFDLDCTLPVNASNPAVIPTTANTTPELYIKVTDATATAGTVTASGSLGAMVLDGDSESISPQLVATGLIFSNLASDPIVGKPKGPFRVKAVDGFGALINVGGDTEVTLAVGNNIGIFCYNVSCSNVVTGNKATINGGTKETPDLYFKVTTAAEVTRAVTASSGTLDPASQNVTPQWIVTGLQIVGLSASPVTGVPAGPFSVKTVDGLGNLKNPTGNLTIGLRTASTVSPFGNANIGVFCYDADCNSQIGSPNLPQILSTTNRTLDLYFKVTTTSTTAVNVEASSGTLDKALHLVTPDLRITDLSIELPGTDIVVGVCTSGFLVRTKDGLGNNLVAPAGGLAVNLDVINAAGNTVTNLGSLFSNNTCTAPVTSVTVGANTNNKSFFYMADTAGITSAGIKASATGVNGSDSQFSVQPISLTLTGPANNISFGDIVGPYTVTSVNQSGSAFPVSALSSVALRTVDVTTGAALPNVVCNSIGTAISSIPLNGVTAAAQFYVLVTDPSKLNPKIVAELTTSPADKPEIKVERAITASRTIRKVRLTVPSVATHYRKCSSAFTVSTLDQRDNLMSVSGTIPLAITMSGVTGGSFYNNSNCTPPSIGSTTSIAVGSNTTNFFFMPEALDAPTAPSLTISAVGMNMVNSPGAFSVAGFALDTSFSADGIATYSMGSTEEGLAMIKDPIGPSGNYMLAGYGLDAGVNKLTIARVLASTSALDSSFGTSGVTKVGVPTATSTTGRSMISDGSSYYVGGSALMPSAAPATGTNSDMVVAKFTSAGALDTAFNSTGITIIDFGLLGLNGEEEVTGIALSPDNSKLYLVGNSVAAGGGISHFAWVVLNAATGAVMAGPFTKELRIGGIAVPASANAVAVTASGKVLIVGKGLNNSTGGNTDFAILQINADGSEDTSFNGNNGILLADLGSPSAVSNDEAKSVLIQSSGNVVVAGVSNNKHAMLRFNSSNFTIDSSFAGGANSGLIVGNTANEEFTALAEDATDNLIAVGKSGNNILVRRYNANGVFFGSATTLSNSVSTPVATPSIARGVFVDANKNVVVGGTASANSTILRYLP